MKERKLTDMQQAFVEEYLKSLNATQSAIKAGYSEKNAGKIGSELLGKTRISDAIQQGMSARSKRVLIEGDDVLVELKRVATSSITDVMTWESPIDEESGRALSPRLNLKDTKDIPREVAVAIQSITVKPGEFGTTVTVKMHDKIKALELAGKHLGLFNENTGDQTQGFAEAIKEAIEKLGEGKS